MFKDFLDLLFPSCCLVCQQVLIKGEEYCCTACVAKLPYADYHKHRHNVLKEKMQAYLPVKHAYTYLLFSKNGSTQQLLHFLKYKNEPQVGVMLGKWFGYQLNESGYQFEYDSIVPVPLHEDKLKKRGYNQSEQFAIGLSESMNVPMECLVSRKIASETQTRKSRLQRWLNVEEIFHVEHPERVKNKRVLLVDDVITTGATIGSCGQALLNAGCYEVSFAAIAEA